MNKDKRNKYKKLSAKLREIVEEINLLEEYKGKKLKPGADPSSIQLENFKKLSSLRDKLNQVVKEIETFFRND